MSQLKTRKTDASVEEFLELTADVRKREDCFTLLELMREVTAEEPAMWGGSIVGFGSYSYKHKSGQGGEWFLTGFSPRKRSLTVYIMPGFSNYESLMQNLGKYKNSVSCLYLNSLKDVDLDVLRDLVRRSTSDMKEANAAGA